MRPMHYRLVNRVPVAVERWQIATWNEPDRRVGLTHLPGKVRVSTVFLALDHACEGEPLLFETMIFNGRLDGEQWRYHTWAEARRGHWRAVWLAVKVGVLGWLKGGTP